MLTHLLSFEQFNQRVKKKFVQPHFGWFKGSYEINKGMQNETQTTQKWS